MYTSRLALRSLALLLSTSAPALAFNCPNGISDTTCNANGSAICSGTSSTVTCDLGINGTDTTTPAVPAIVLGPHNDTAVWAWGVDGLNDDFCCIVSGVTDVTVEPADVLCAAVVVDITVSGTDLDDHIWLSSSAGSLGCYYTTVDGRDGEDWIHGSGDARNHDYLYGGPGHDHMAGLAGDDHLYGEDDIDDLFGGDGNDQIAGGDGADIIGGEGGNDTICGDDASADDTDNDSISGGADDDIIYDATSTLINGNGGNDYCGATTCDGNPAETTCSVP